VKLRIGGERHRARRLFLCAVVCSALVGAASACSSSNDSMSPSTPSSTRPHADAPVTTAFGGAPLAVVLGDSNTFLATREIQKGLLQAGLTPDARGISGSGVKDDLEDWFPAAKAVGEGHPAVVVIALGTNDTVIPDDVSAFASRADQLLQAIGDLPVVWVTHTETGTANGHNAAAEKQVNDVIRALPSTHPNVTVLDLAPELARRPNLLGPDKLHYSPSGRVWFADQIAKAASKAVTS
jgi:lysophospholipase L1-like esterase